MKPAAHILCSFLFSLSVFCGEVSVDDFSKSLQQLFDGGDVVLLDRNLSSTDLDFFSKLEVSLSADFKIGRRLEFFSTLTFDSNQKDDPTSKYNRLRNKLIEFFRTTTNATNIRKDGNDRLTDEILRNAENMMQAYGSSKVSINIHAFHPNDAFCFFPRWHFDGLSEPWNSRGDVNFAAVFKGEPTRLAKVSDAGREALEKKMDSVRELCFFGKSIDSQSLIEMLIAMKDENLDEEKPIDYEIERILKLKSTCRYDLPSVLSCLKYRILIHEYMKKNTAFEVVEAKPHEAALFTMAGKKPLLHSEPNMEGARLFFAIRLYDEKKDEPFSDLGDAKIGFLEDPLRY